MPDFIIKPDTIKARHESKAMNITLARNWARISTEIEMKHDWFEGGHLLSKDLASKIVGEMSTKHDYKLKISDVVIPYLIDISLEEFKAILAYYNWMYSGRKTDDDQNRIKKDWEKSEEDIKKFLDESLEVNNITNINRVRHTSVFESLEEYYIRNRADLIEKKAYWLDLAFPHTYCPYSSCDQCKDNYNRAMRYVDNFYDLSRKIIKNQDIVNTLSEIRNLILGDPEITNVFELFFLEIHEIVTTH